MTRILAVDEIDEAVGSYHSHGFKFCLGMPVGDPRKGYRFCFACINDCNIIYSLHPNLFVQSRNSNLARKNVLLSFQKYASLI